MNREIKFRAWDKERKELRQVQLIDFSAWWVSTGSSWERGNALEYGERNSFQNEETDRHILMQYTGLKDKNGIEIYEGDQANHVEPDSEDGPAFEDEGIVQWENEPPGYYLVCELAEGTTKWLITSAYTEVTGNIYESEVTP